MADTMDREISAVVPSDEMVLSKAVANAAVLWHLTNETLGEIIGVSPASASRIRSGSKHLNRGRKEFELGQLFVRIFRSLDSITGSDDEASVSWLTTENKDLDARPIDLIRRVEGLTLVANYVDAFRARV
jgi:uncharacterized protein (DUF2384 family)